MIGIIGGYGTVGIPAALTLQKWGRHQLKIGGRNPEIGQAKYDHLMTDAEWKSVDAKNEDSLNNFIQGCDLVVNCAGPSHQISTKIAKKCSDYGCHFVDAGMDNNLEETMSNVNGKAMVFAAGAFPGLSGIFPVWASQNFDRVHSLLSYTGGLDQLTPTGAEDYFEGVLNTSNHPQAAWRYKMVPNELRRINGIKLPFFPRESTVYPVFDSESLIVANRLQLSKGDWYVVADGENITSALDAAGLYRSHPEHTIDKLCLATQLDTAGKKTYFRLLLQLTGVKEDIRMTKTMILEADGTVSLTGAVAGTLGIAALEGKLKPAVQHASEIENVGFVMDRLRQENRIHEVREFDTDIEPLLIDDEGVI